jgi:hypothetical protein
MDEQNNVQKSRKRDIDLKKVEMSDMPGRNIK